MKTILILFLIFVGSNTFGQLTSKDLRLSLDNYTVVKDSAARITKAQLMQSKSIILNYTWANVRSFEMMFGSDVINIVRCAGSNICPETKPLLEKLMPGSTVIFQPQVFNNKGKEIEWPAVVFWIIE